MMNVGEQKSLVSPTHKKRFRQGIHKATRSRIFNLLQKRNPEKTGPFWKDRLDKLTDMLDHRLIISAESEMKYADVETLEYRVVELLNGIRNQRRACPPTPVDMSNVSRPPHTTFTTANNLPNATLQSGTIPSGFSSGFGDSRSNKTDHSLYGDGVEVSTVGTSQQRHQTAAANVQMVDVYRPNTTHQFTSEAPITYTNGGGSAFNGCQQVSAGFPTSYGDNGFYITANFDQSIYSDGVKVSAIGSDQHRYQTAGANVEMLDVYRPNNIHQSSSGFGNSRNNSVPLATRPMTSQEILMSTYMPNLSNPLVQPFGQLQAAPHMHRYSMSNPDSFGSSNFYGVVPSSGSMAVLAQNPNHVALTSNQSNLQGMEQNPLLLHQLGYNGFQSAYTNKENLAQVSQQLLDRGLHQQAHGMEHQGQRSQQIYPGQLQKQERLLYDDAHQTQLATPVKHGSSLEVYKEALQKEAINGFRPSKSKDQQNAVKDQYTGAQRASVHNSQVNSSPSFRPHPHQKQPEPVMVQTQPSPQKLHPKQPEPILVQTQSSKPQPNQKQPESVVVQTESSQNKTHPKQSKSGLVQTQSSQKKPNPKQKQPGPVLVQMQSSLKKPNPKQKQPEPVLVQMQSSLKKPNPKQKQPEPVLVQTQSSLQKPNPDQKQPESVLVQTQAYLQNPTQISENNSGEREQIMVNLCQRSPMQPKMVNRCSSARPPKSQQIVSPTSTAKRKRLPDGNNALSKLVKANVSQIDINKIRWLLFMSHARYCSAPEGKCITEFCFRAKEILKHAQQCKVPDCTYLYCLETKEFMPHYKQCKDKSCRVCVFVKSFKKKKIEAFLRAAKRLQGQPRESLESRQACNKVGTEAPSVDDDDDLQPSTKRLKIEQPETKSNSLSVCGVVSKSHSSMDIQGKDGLLSDDCKSVEVKPMEIDVSDASKIPITREVEKHVVEDTPKAKNGGDFATDDKAVGKLQCMNEMNVSKEENVKALDASKMEITSLIELFTPEQVREHMCGLRQWIGQSKIKADRNKAMESSITENSCQLCAVQELVFDPIPIYCTPCGVRIKRNASHYTVLAGESRHYVCAPCYNDARENSVSIDGNSIPKARLEKKKNDDELIEAWVQCDKCEAWQHQICALFNNRTNHGEATKYTCPKCYIQEVERGKRRPLPQSAIPGAKSLPVTTLSNHIEQRLFKNLNKERQERARLQGRSYDEVPGAESLAVRVVASVDKVLEVKECFRELFRDENYPSEFPYKSKAILLFQKIESVEVCLFGMFVQEFGTKSGPPNQRRVYISYLDSVKYFRPEVRTVSGEALRTFVYHEILIGYLDYCKKRGFTSCYLWACPPLKGEDYILYCHPEIQKTPKTDKLRDWYLAMLRKASKEDVVVECTNLYDQFFVQSGECRANVTAARLPYFDGDYWPSAAADLIHQMSQGGDGTNSNRKGYTKKVISKRALKAVSQSENLSVNASKDRLTMQKLGEIICPLKEDFIMVHLQHCCKHCRTLMVSGNRWVCKQCKNFQICDKCNEAEQNRIEKERHPINQREKHMLFPVAINDVPIEIEDKDDNIESEFFDNRQAFLNLCQGNSYQYDTLRRAKHSSMMLLYHLHNPTAPAFATICTICQQVVENSQGWRCEVCPGYDVCNACHSKASVDHPHNLISCSSATYTNVQQIEQRNQNYQIKHEKLKQLLVHVITCRSQQCQIQDCHRWKLLFKHCIGCKIGPLGCLPCQKFWFVIERHARCCRDSQCTVPKCRDIRANNIRKQKQVEKRRRAAVMEMMRERAAEATRTS